MLPFGAIVLSMLLAYRATSVGLLAVLNRCMVGVVAVALGGGLAGGLRAAIPAQGSYLQGACFIVISMGSYLLLRGLVMYYMLERDVPLPGMVDRVGAALCGFFGGLMLCGYISMVTLVFPVPEGKFKQQLTYTAEYGVASVRLVGSMAGTEAETGLKINLDNILFETPRRQNPSSQEERSFSSRSPDEPASNR